MSPLPPSPSTSLRFRPNEHLRKPSEFRRVYEHRCSVSDAWLIVYARANDLGYPRLGMSVSRKFGQATRRNRLRRLYREAFRLARADIAFGLDLVLIPRAREIPSLGDLKTTLPQLVTRLARRVLPSGGKA